MSQQHRTRQDIQMQQGGISHPGAHPSRGRRRRPVKRHCRLWPRRPPRFQAVAMGGDAAKAEDSAASLQSAAGNDIWNVVRFFVFAVISLALLNVGVQNLDRLVAFTKAPIEARAHFLDQLRAKLRQRFADHAHDKFAFGTDLGAKGPSLSKTFTISRLRAFQIALST